MSTASGLEDPFLLAGTLLEGQYRTDDIIGEGGFGVVYRGRHLSLDQPIAVKVLKGLDSADAGVNSLILEKFRSEARLLYTLSQSSLHIVRCLDFGAATMPSGAWAPFMILEWLDGQSLADDLIERRNRGMRGRSVAETMAILEPVADGLSVAHQQQVAHRDVKPANVFLLRAGGKGGVKVLDFGIAKIMKEGEAAGTKGTFSSFTWLYAAPEQLDPRVGATGLATDVYGFGLLLTELLTDKKPIDDRDVVSILKTATDPNRRPTPRFRGATISDELEAVCRRALAVDPTHRYQNIGELWAAVTAAVSSEGRRSGPPPPMISQTVTSAMPSVASFDRSTPKSMQQVPPASAHAPTAVAPPPAQLQANPMAQTELPRPNQDYMQHAPMPPSMVASSLPAPTRPLSSPAMPASPPMGTPPPGFRPSSPMLGPSPPPGTAPGFPVAAPPPPPPGPPMHMPPPGVMVNPQGSNTALIIAIVAIVLGVMFAGSCALVHGACNAATHS